MLLKNAYTGNMDKLIEYINNVSGVKLAQRLGCTRQLVSLWKTGREKPSPMMARRIEDVSMGQVTREDIRPDLFGDID